MKLFLFHFLLLIGISSVWAQNTLTISIKDSSTMEPISNATIIVDGNKIVTKSDGNGLFTFTLLKKTNRIVLTISADGFVSGTFETAIDTVRTQTFYLSPLTTDVEEVLVSALRTNSRIEDIPTRIEVLGLDDLNEENGVKPGNIMSLLGDIAGIQMQQVSASSGNTYARVQGLNGRYTQLLKDGLPLFGGMSGSFGILQIPPLDLKQIEIIKGSVSTLYGGGAIGGIINLVSKDPGYKPEISITANRSSLRESNLNAYFSKRNKNVGFTFFAGQTIQGEVDKDGDGLSDVAKSRTTVIHPKLLLYLSKKSTLVFNYTFTNDNRKGGNMAYVSNPSNSDSLFHIFNMIFRQNADAKWTTKINSNSNFNVKFGSSILNQEGHQFIYYSEMSYFHKLNKSEWVGGMNLNGDNFNNQSKSHIKLQNYTYSTLGLFIQNAWHPSYKWTIESGFRVDLHSKYKIFPLPRLSLMYKANKSVTARINSGFGYIIPNQISYVNPETDLLKFQNNSTLHVERSKGVNGDINIQRTLFNKLRITLNQSFFFTLINSPIVDSSNSTILSLYNETKSLRSRGLQTYIRAQHGEVELYLGYVFTDVNKLYDPKQPLLPITPKHNLSATLFYEGIKNLRLGIESSFIAGQLDGNYKPTKNYLLFAAMAQYNYKNFTFVLNGENLLDFRQNKTAKIYEGSLNKPVFNKLWAPIDGRVINFSIRWKM
jgi:outer membrane receptor for ferrienterochelin and colicins